MIFRYLLPFLLLNSLFLKAQDNQDCITKKPICSTASFSGNSNGQGDVDDISSSDPVARGCLNGGEHQTSWYYFKASTSGNLNFLIIPDVSTDDYDFSVWGPNVSCPVAGIAPIRCNFSGQDDTTGLNDISMATSETVDKFCKTLQVVAGEEYLLLIDNYRATTTSFRIEFNGTATLDCAILSPGISTSKSTICLGESVSLSMNNVQTRRWYEISTPGVTLSTATSFVVSPTITTKYVCEGIDNSSNPYTDTVQIVVNSIVISASANPSTICPGKKTTLTASGGIQYQWSKSTDGSFTNTNSSFDDFPTLTTTYQVTVTAANTCSSTASVIVNVYPAPPPISISVPSNTVCKGDTVTFTAVGTGFVSYSWADQSQPQTPRGTGTTFTKNNLQANYGTILTGTDANGCTAQALSMVTVRDLPFLQSTANPDSICPGFNSILSAEGADTYEWKLFGSVFSSSQMTTVNPYITTTYIVTGSDFFNCKRNDTVIVNVRPTIPVKILSLSDSICQGDKAELIGSGVAETYSWTIQGNPTVLATTQGFTPSPITDTTYILTSTHSSGCISRDTIRIIVRSRPTVSIVTNAMTICPGDNIRLSGRGANTYSWAYKTDPGFFLSADSVFFDTPTDTTTYITIGTDNFGCKDTAELEIIVYPQPKDIAIFGVPYVCPGASNVPYDPSHITPLSIYKWTINPGNSPATQTANTAKFNFGAPGTATITMQETNQYGCKGNVASYQVEIKTILTPGLPEGEDSVCTANVIGVSYNSPYNTPGSTYTWHIIGGNITSGNGSDNITVDWTATGANAGKLWYDEHSNPSCDGTSDTLKVSIFPTPNTGAIIGNSNVCIESTEIYSVNSSNTSTYSWTISTGGTLKSGQGTRFAEVNWTITGAQEVKVTEISQEGCPGAEQTITVTVNPLPTLLPTDIKGESLVCLATIKGQAYYINPVNAHATSSYNWSIQGGTIISGNGTDTVIVDWDFNTNILHNISVYERNQNNCLSNAVTKVITVDGDEPEITVVSLRPEGGKIIDVSWKISYRNGQLNTYNLYKRIHNNNSISNTWKLIAKDYLATSYEDGQASPGNYSYEYRYTIKDNCNDSSTSTPHNSILLKAAADQASNTVKLNWNRYKNWKEDVARYEVWRKLDQENKYSLYTEVGLDTIFTAKNGHEGFVHCYRIKAIEKTGSTQSWSNDTCVNFANLINIPSAFSPNGDGVNDNWVIRNVEAYKNISIEIFNRWGEMVYKTQGYLNTWDGTKNGKNLPDATYYYVIKLNQSIEGQKDTYSGTVTMVR